jgi:transcriptional regulator with XRE-family HTH domain
MASETSAAVVAPIADLDVQIGRRAHQLMWDRQMTQTAFAARVGMDQSSVAKRLRGKLGWSAAHLVQAATVLGTTVSYLVGEDDEKAPTPKGGGHSLPGLDSNQEPAG